MRSRFLRQSSGSFASSPQTRGTRFSATPRVSSLLLGFSVAAGALLVAPQAPRAWAAPIVGGDENGPKVQIVAPAYQDVLKGRTRILVGVKTTQFNPSTVQLFLDDKPASNVLSLSAMPSSAFDWDTRQLSDGPHKLSVRVTDTQGFKGWAEVNVYVNNNNVQDTEAPDLKWNNVGSYQQLSGQAQIALEAKDNFGVKWIIVSLNPIDKANHQPAEHSWLLARPPYTFNLDTSKVPDGVYALSARAWDSMDQEGQSKTLTIGVVNSAVNATTVAQSLDGMKAMEQAQNKSNLGAPATAPSAPAAPAPVKTPRSTSAAPAKPAPSAKIPDGYTLLPQNTTPRSAQPKSVDTDGATPSLSSIKPGVKVASPATAAASAEATTNAVNSLSNRVASLSKPEKAQGTTAETASLTSHSVSGMLAPASSSGVTTSDAGEAQEEKSPVLIARAATPQAAPRVQSQQATLSALNSTTSDALAPARAPQSEETLTDHIGFARFAQPAGATRVAQVAPVLSAAPASVAAVLSSAPKVNLGAATTPKRTVKPAVVTTPTVAQTSSVSKVILRKPTPVQSSTATKLAPASATVAAKATTKAPTRMAAIPRMEGPVEVVPQGTIEHPSITVAPIQAAFNAALPAFHQVRSASSLRSIATHYGLPVELVAAANNWRTDKRVLPGMIVQLPRQVQISYNGQKIQGDVTSLLAGDTTFTAMRFLFEHTGGKIVWDAAKQEVVATKGGSTIRVKVGSKVATVNNQEVMMQIAAFLFEGRTMVPTRFFEEGLNAQVQWDPDNGHIVVAMAG